MFSTLTGPGAASTLEALTLGASDYATKPSNTGSPAVAIAAIRCELIPKIKELCRGQIKKVTTAFPPLPALPVPRPPNRRIEIVTIGTSTGGPNALAEVLPHFPKDFPVPIVVVQHMPPMFTRLLATRLAGHSAIPVHEGHAGAVLAPGEAWLAPGNFHMTVRRAGVFCSLQLNQNPPENSCRPAVDALFRSVSEVFGARSLAVVMTGMGSDGVIGSQCIRQKGGEVIIQDEASSVVWGMPGLVYAAGQADAVYPLEKLGQEIIRRVLQSRAPRTTRPPIDQVALEPRAT
jgi:two-component system chemotaxis response regulator CheB